MATPPDKDLLDELEGSRSDIIDARRIISVVETTTHERHETRAERCRISREAVGFDVDERT